MTEDKMMCLDGKCRSKFWKVIGRIGYLHHIIGEYDECREVLDDLKEKGYLSVLTDEQVNELYEYFTVPFVCNPKFFE